MNLSSTTKEENNCAHDQKIDAVNLEKITPTMNDAKLELSLQKSENSAKIDRGDVIKTDIDEVLDKGGSFGRFQYLVQILFTYLHIMVGYQSVLSYFIANDPNWKCRTNSSSTFCGKNYGKVISNYDAEFTQRCHLTRNEWTYSTDRKYSFLTEFDLVCSKSSIVALASGIFHLGGAIGVPFSGLVADRYGRKFTLLLCMIIATLFSFSCSFVTSMYQLVILRAFLGAASWSCSNIAFVYLGEFITPKYRTISSTMFCMGFPLSELFLNLLAYYIREWRNLQLYALIPSLVCFIFLVLIPKSPRWLLSNNSEDEAINVLQKICKFNKKPLRKDLSLNKFESPTTPHQRVTYFDMMKNLKVVLTTLSQGFIWMSISMTYYMISLQSSNIGGDMYKAFALSSLSEIPSTFAATYTCNRYGRKKTILACLVLTGALMGGTMVIPYHFSGRFTATMILLMFAKFFITIALLGNMIWSFEIYPTAFRLQGYGICIGFERIGSFMAPFLTTVLYNFNANFPYSTVLLCVLGSAAGGLYLPETNKKPTRETFEDFF